MKLYHLFISSVLTAAPIALFANAETDRKIESAAKDSYNLRVLLDNGITVKADDSVATLTGVASDSQLKALAEDTVSNLPGVVRVDNRITLAPALKEHSDAWITWKLRYQLLARASVSNRDTDVKVNNGIVTLTGVATSAAEKELVGLYASEIEGAKSVQNLIVVMPASPTGKVVAESIDDASITSQVKYALLTHKATSALKTKVATAAGTVTLTGEAANSAEKSLAEKITSSVRGVKSVTNEMTVKS